MDMDVLDKLLNHLERCQSENKPLLIHIDEDLLKILPLPRKLILDLLSDPLISTLFHLSDDQKILSYQNNVGLCSIDQNRGESCHSNSCEQFHLCQNYLLKKKCSEFDSSGKCSHSHSLSTHHNEQILRKYNLSSKDPRTFSLISRLIQLSLTNPSKIIVQTIHRQPITDQTINQWLDQHRSLLKSQKLMNSYTVELTFDDEEVASMMEDYIRQHHSTTAVIKKDFQPEPVLTNGYQPSLGRGRGRLPTTNESLSNNPSMFSQRLASNPPSTTTGRRFILSNRLSGLENNSTVKPTKGKSPDPVLITYTYRKPFIDEHLCYLLGPGKEQIIEKDQCEIISCLSLGYCRVRNMTQGKEIEKSLYAILPDSLNRDVLIIPDDLQLIVRSSAAETVFQPNQTHYAILSEPTKIQVNIEIINAPTDERQRSSKTSNGKFHIAATGSSIDVISGDITEIPVDMMIGISTSNNLRESILQRAGPDIEAQYKEKAKPDGALLVDGGSTKAQKILFVPWQTNIEEVETTETQKSLSELVHWCIEQAKKKGFKSISFPPIGTGQLGLDPFVVCEAMIGAASERLHQDKLDVSFVIYSSTGMAEEDECYQVFRIYLNNLCEQVKTPASPMNHERRISKKEVIRREISGKQIFIVCDSSKQLKHHHHSLIKSLEDLIYEKTFDLSLIEPSSIDSLIEICLQSNIHPRLDYSREELTLRGDKDSVFQCFFNLRQGKKVYQYTYQSNSDEEETIINPYISLKIDEASAVGEANISIKDNERTIYHIDVNKLQLRLNKDRQTIPMDRKPLNIRPPSSWSSSSLMIRTVQMNKSSYNTLECYQLFQETMSDWQIERIDSIENVPLYSHFLTNNPKSKKEFYFHGCPYSSVQSIIYYGFHSTNPSLCFTRDALHSHLYGTHYSTDRKFYQFAVQIAKTNTEKNSITLSNDELCFALPTYLIVYRKREHF